MRERLGNLRHLQLSQGLIDFSSNDYLGLARSKQLETATFEEKQKYHSKLNGLGSTGSRLLTGHCAYIQDLEEKVASFHGYEAGTIFNCGYMANIGLISTVAHSKSIIFFDAAIHASTYEGIRLSRAHSFAFKHNDLNHLEKRLKNSPHHIDRFICIESVYSTDGSLAPLIEIAHLAQKYNAHLIVDEAHAVGVYGPKGQGLVAQCDLTDQVFAQVTTFGKALGTYGAIVLGKHLLKKALVNFATAYIYTTALPFQMLAAIKCSYDIFPMMNVQREHLQKLIHLFQKTDSNSSRTAIQSISIQGNHQVKKASEELKQLGFDVRALMSPTVQKGHEILRICLHAFNSEHELQQMLFHLKNIKETANA